MGALLGCKGKSIGPMALHIQNTAKYTRRYELTKNLNQHQVSRLVTDIEALTQHILT
jgi:hypothetical protein